MIVDLSIPISEGMPIAPNHPRFKQEELSYETEAHEIRFRSMTSSNHVGTHVDAPAHFVEGGKAIDDLDLELFGGAATVVDLREYSGQPITAAVLEANVEQVPEHGRFIMATGDVDDLFFEGKFFAEASYPTKGAAEWLLDRGAKLVAMDFLGDDVDDPTDPVHDTLLGADVPIVDYICNTAAIATRGSVEFFCYPLSIPGFDAAPTRAVARV